MILNYTVDGRVCGASPQMTVLDGSHNDIPKLEAALKSAPRDESYCEACERLALQLAARGDVAGCERWRRELWSVRIAVLREKGTVLALQQARRAAGFSQSVAMWRELYEAAQKIGGPEMLNVTFDLAKVLATAGHRDEAKPLLEIVANGRRASLGAKHPITRAVRAELARLNDAPDVLEKATSTDETDDDAAWDVARAAARLAARTRHNRELPASLRAYDDDHSRRRPAFPKKTTPRVVRGAQDPLTEAEFALIHARRILQRVEALAHPNNPSTAKAPCKKETPWQLPRPTVFDHPRTSRRRRCQSSRAF